MKRWRIAPLRAGRSLYWVVFYDGIRVGRSTDLPRLVYWIAKCESNDGWGWWLIGEQW